MLAVVAGGFYVFHVGPLYMDNFEVKEAAAQAFNVYWLEGPDSAKKKLLIRLNERGKGEHLAVDDNGVESFKPGFNVDPDNVTIVETSGELRVRVTYERTVIFKPLKKRKVYHLTAEKVGRKAN